MLHPYSPLRIRWDVFTSLVLLVTAFLTPLRVGFAIADSDDDAALFGVDRVMDATFLLDLLLNFRTGFHGASGDVVMEPRNVAAGGGHRAHSAADDDRVAAGLVGRLPEKVDLGILCCVGVGV